MAKKRSSTTSNGSQAASGATKSKRQKRIVSAKTSTSQTNPAEFRSFTDLPREVPLKLNGLIAPNGQGGGAADGRGNTWTFSAELVAWKVQGGPVVNESLLLVWRKISERKLRVLMQATPNLSIIEFKALRPASSNRGRRFSQAVRLELTGLGRTTKDAGLNAIKEELCKPVELRDRTFGVLRLDRESEQFAVKSAFRGESLNVYFRTQSLNELQELIELAKPLWRQRPQWFKNFIKAAYQHYQVTMENEWWEGVKPLTEAKYRELLGWPVSIEFFKKDGKFQFIMGGWSEDLYTDHGIEASGSGINNFVVEF